MAEFIPQLSSSPKAGRRGISETDRRAFSPTGLSKEEDEVFSPLREFSPLLSSNGGGSVSERETPDGNVFIPSPDLAGWLYGRLPLRGDFHYLSLSYFAQS